MSSRTCPSPPHHPPLSPELAGQDWLAFRLDEPEESAAARFRDRYGAPPDLILESLNNLLLGPVPAPAEAVA